MTSIKKEPVSPEQSRNTISNGESVQSTVIDKVEDVNRSPPPASVPINSATIAVNEAENVQMS